MCSLSTLLLRLGGTVFYFILFSNNSNIFTQVINKNKDKEEEEEEEVDEKQFADNIKYDEEYYNNYIKKYDKEGR